MAAYNGTTEFSKDSNPIVTIEMENGGVMKIELYPEVAPNTVNNFISLVKKGYYNGVVFHRVIRSFMIQGGDPQGNGTGGPGYSIKGEFAGNNFENNLVHDRGVISMARTMAPNSAGSQFFIMHKNSPHLDRQYAGFGRLIEGIEVLDAIASVECNHMDQPVIGQMMKTVTVDTKGVEYPEPVKM
ncbi:MAG: peptidylprolyl isomerase [Turicibacter sp.]